MKKIMMIVLMLAPRLAQSVDGPGTKQLVDFGSGVALGAAVSTLTLGVAEAFTNRTPRQRTIAATIANVILLSGYAMVLNNNRDKGIEGVGAIGGLLLAWRVTF